MSISITDFWRLAIESRLLTPEQCQQVAGRFSQTRSSDEAAKPVDTKSLAEWLVGQKLLTKYQAKVLLAGRAGPFHYADYRIQDRIASGRLSGWFRAVHLPTRHPVLLQFVPPAQAKEVASGGVLAGFVSALTSIKDPHLARCYAFVDTGNHKLFVWESLRGTSLEEQLAGTPTLPAAQALRVGLQIARGLVTLHGHGIVHGDVRPHHVWLSAEGRTQLICDLSTRRAPIDTANPADDSLLQERADYLAPEFLQPGRSPDVLTDVYALGCALYRMLTGRVPFAGGDIAHKLQRHATEPIRPLESFGIAAEVARIVTYMMAKNPAIRLPSAQVIVEQLSALLNDRQPAAEVAAAPSAASFEQWLQSARTTEFSREAPGTGLPKPEDAAPLVPPERVDLSAQGTAVPIVVPVVETATSIAARRRGVAARKKKSPWSVWAGIAGGALLLIGVIVVLANRNVESDIAGGPDRAATSTSASTTGNAAATPNSVATELSATATPSSDADAERVTYEVVTDDGESLWASPTSGRPIDLELLPLGSQCFLHVRPAELLRSGEGERLLKALGPDFEQRLQSWQTAAGVSLTEIESLTISLLDDDQSLRPTFAVRLAAPSEPDPPQSLAERWGNPAANQVDGFQQYEANGWSFLVPPKSGGRVFVMGARSEIDDIVERKGTPPPLHRTIDRLHNQSDSARHLTILFTQQFVLNELLRDGRQYAAVGDLRRFREAVDWFLGSSYSAASASFHLDESLYLELRLMSDLKQDRYTAAGEMRGRLAELPSHLESYLAQLQPIPYWGTVAFRFPSMVRYLHEQSRAGVEGDHAVINAYLPAVAAHNLLFSSSMAIASSPGQPGTRVATAPPPAAPKTLEEVLAEKMTVEIPQQDLVNVLKDIERSVNDEQKGLAYPFKIKMMGNDLKEGAITQNQKIVDFKMENHSLAEILTGLVRKANPDPSVTEPSDPKQNLIWAVGPDPDDKAKQIVFITTRTGAARDGHEIPAVFQAK